MLNQSKVLDQPLQFGERHAVGMARFTPADISVKGFTSKNEMTARLQDSSNFLNHLPGTGGVIDIIRRDGEIKKRIGERKRFSVALADVNPFGILVDALIPAAKGVHAITMARQIM